MRQHQEGVFRLAYLLLGNAQEAEDITQETFIAAFRALHRFDMERPLRPWLLRITSNLTRNRHRSVGRYLSMVQRFMLQERLENVATVEDMNIRQQEATLLWQAIRRLDTDDQTVIYLRYFLELSVTETADVLDVAPGTVKSRLYRALKRLRVVIERDFPTLQPLSIQES